MRRELRIEVRGARDLAELWRAMPLGILRYALPEPQPGLDPLSISDTLRGCAWRDRCASLNCESCVDLGQKCAQADSGACRADMLFPMHVGGGAPSWRMARLLTRWLPQAEELQVVCLGEAACSELGWVARTLRQKFGLRPVAPAQLMRFSEMELDGGEIWRMQLATPWLLGKNMTLTECSPAPEDVAREIHKSLKIRAHKFTALCSSESIWQRLGSHLVHHVADELLPGALRVLNCDMDSVRRVRSSIGNSGTFAEVAWVGSATLRAKEILLPWLSLLALCGGGENADKGFGGVEFLPQNIEIDKERETRKIASTADF